MATTILVNGVDVTDAIDLTSVQVDENPTQSLFTMDCDMVIPSPGQYAVPRAGQTIAWTSPNGLEFAGIIGQVDPETADTPQQMRYALKATDYTFQFDRHLIVEEFTQQQDAYNIIQTLLKEFINQGPASAYFTMNNVQHSPAVATRKWNYVKPSAALKDLAGELSWTWYVDYNRDLHFFPIEQFVSPLPTNTLNADTDLANYGDLLLREDATQLKNRVFITGFTVLSENPITDTFTGDGSQLVFHLSQPPGSLIYATPTVTVGGVAYIPRRDVANGLQGQPVGPAGDYAYFNTQNITLRFDTAPASGVAIVAAYKYQYHPVVMVEDPLAQAYMAKRDGSDGVYEYWVNDAALTAPDTSLAEAQGQVYLAKYGYPAITGTLVSYTQGWRAGQSFFLNSAVRFGGLSNKQMWVLKNTKSIVNAAGMVKYQLEISDRPFAF